MRGEIEVLVLSKDGCHLCEDALAVVEAVQRRHPFTLTVVKIAEGDQWYESYRDKIPVGFVNGRRAFMYRTTEQEFYRELSQ